MFGRKNEQPKGLKIIIVGCGKVGATLVEQLVLEGHDITVIDTNISKIEELINSDKYIIKNNKEKREDMSKIKDVDISKSLLLIISVIFASIIINLFIRCGFDFSYLKLSAADINKLDEVSYTTSAIFVLIKRLKHIFLINLLK